jgi:hypothetical protein
MGKQSPEIRNPVQHRIEVHVQVLRGNFRLGLAELAYQLREPDIFRVPLGVQPVVIIEDSEDSPRFRKLGDEVRCSGSVIAIGMRKEKNDLGNAFVCQEVENAIRVADIDHEGAVSAGKDADDRVSLSNIEHAYTNLRRHEFASLQVVVSELRYPAIHSICAVSR